MISMAYYPFLNIGEKHGQSLKISKSSKKEFMRTLRVVSEAIFYVLLMSYRNSLQASLELSQEKGEDTTKCSAAVECAEKALEMAVKAASVHVGRKIYQAARLTQEASKALKERLVMIYLIFLDAR
jgi:hypothetical protein